MKIQLLLISCVLFSSCSMFEGRGPIGGKDDGKTVSKKQYDALEKKYNDLNKKYNMLAAADAIKADDEVMLEEVDLKTKLQMAKVDSIGSDKVGNTVDTFRAAKASRNNEIVIKPDVPINVAQIEKEIEILRSANALIVKNRFSDALRKLKSIEKSTSKQIRVRTKYATGEVLFRQQEYDLAMQIFEEIITKDSFSGVVLKTLGRLIACSSKLKLKRKEDQYSSMLYDFFES